MGVLLDALAARDGERLLAAGDELCERSLDLGGILEDLQRAFHDLAVAVELGTSVQPPFERFGRAFSAEDLQLYYQIALLGSRDLEFAPDPKIGFDMTLIRLASFEPAATDHGVQPPKESRDSESAQDSPEPSASEQHAPLPPKQCRRSPARSMGTGTRSSPG